MARLGLLRVFLSSTGSAAPPALLEAGFPELDLDRFPPGTEPLDLEVKPGVHLRGVFVPSDEGAPVVLHLLESEGSITYGAEGLTGFPNLVELRDQGFASLVVDYRGIGASDGSRYPRNVPVDARTAWEEALRRAGGDPKRVVLRGSSFGTLAAACLLQQGMDPAAVFLVAPVRSETVVRHWAARYYPRLVAVLGTLLSPKPVKVDIVRELGRVRCPLLVYAPDDDYALPEAERVAMQRAVSQAGGRWVGTAYGHPACVIDAHHVVPAERELLANVFPEQPPVADRLRRYREATANEVPEERLLELAQHFLLEPPRLAWAASDNGLSGEAMGSHIAWLRRICRRLLQDLPDDPLRALIRAPENLHRSRVDDLRSLTHYLGERKPEGPWTPGELLALATELYGEAGEPSVDDLELLFRAGGLPVRRTEQESLQVYFDGTWHG